jgi:hypothetical protein
VLQAAGHEEVQWAVLRVLEQISGFEDGARLLARCDGLREALTGSTASHPAMGELARHISSNLPAGEEPVADVKAPARVAARVKAEELGEIVTQHHCWCLFAPWLHALTRLGGLSFEEGGGAGRRNT